MTKNIERKTSFKTTGPAFDRLTLAFEVAYSKDQWPVFGQYGVSNDTVLALACGLLALDCLIDECEQIENGTAVFPAAHMTRFRLSAHNATMTGEGFSLPYAEELRNFRAYIDACKPPLEDKKPWVNKLDAGKLASLAQTLAKKAQHLEALLPHARDDDATLNTILDLKNVATMAETFKRLTDLRVTHSRAFWGAFDRRPKIDGLQHANTVSRMRHPMITPDMSPWQVFRTMSIVGIRNEFVPNACEHPDEGFEEELVSVPPAEPRTVQLAAQTPPSPAQ